MTTTSVKPASRALRGRLRVASDKSVSHRAVLFAAMAQGESRLTGVLDSEDVHRTIDAVRALGARVDVVAATETGLSLVVAGWGRRGPKAPSEALDCGNSGTTARLLLGALAGWPIRVTLTGDESLSRRPMLRVTEPLTAMGASFELSEKGTLPITTHGGTLVGIRQTLPVASAQVKTAILLAGLTAQGSTYVTEPARSRDHTQLMLPAFGITVHRDEASFTTFVEGPGLLSACDVAVPGDPSSAAFWGVAAAIVPGSEVHLVDVDLNPTRLGAFVVLERMGADIDIVPTGHAGLEPIGRIEIRYAEGLHATVIEADEVPSLVDEVPILAIAAAHCVGTTRFDGIGELRVKESNRLAAIVEGLSALGVDVDAGDDWLEVTGTVAFVHGHLDALADHRLAMSWVIAGLAGAGARVEGFEAVAVSYPGFGADLECLLEGKGCLVDE